MNSEHQITKYIAAAASAAQLIVYHTHVHIARRARTFNTIYTFISISIVNLL